MPISESPTTSFPTDMFPQCPGGIWVWGYARREDEAISCARRQWLPVSALHPLVGCYVIRQVLVRYHSGYDFARLLNSEPPTILLSPGTFLGCPGGISVWNDEDCLDGPTWTGVGMVMELTLTFGNMGVEKRMWDCALQAESDWEWDCRRPRHRTPSWDYPRPPTPGT